MPYIPMGVLAGQGKRHARPSAGMAHGAYNPMGQAPAFEGSAQLKAAKKQAQANIDAQIASIRQQLKQLSDMKGRVGSARSIQEVNSYT